MLPKYHLISSVIAALLMTGYFKWLAIFVFVGGFLIDFDHYLYYAFKKRDWNLKRCLKYYDPERISVDELHIFHTIEFWAMMIILSFYFTFVFATLLGMILHQALDSYDYYKRKLKCGRVKTIYGWINGMHSESYYYLKIKSDKESSFVF